MRRLIVLFASVAMSTSLFCQNSPTDSQNLRALLEEVRQLRRDLQSTTVAAQRVQIALYRLQLQDAAVARTTKLVDDAHSRLAALAAERKAVTTQIEQVDDERNRTQNVSQRKALEEEVIPQLKRHLEQLAADERQWQAKANEAEAQLSVEQLKLDQLHAVLDQLDQALQNVGRTTASTSSH